MHNKPSIIAGKNLERYFDLHQALLEFGMLFEQETNDRAIAIVGAAFLDTLLEHILINFLIGPPGQANQHCRFDGSLLR